MHVGDTTLSTRTLALLLAGAGLTLSVTACTGGTTTTPASGAGTPAIARSSGPASPSGGPSGSAPPVARVQLAAEDAFPFQAALLNLKATDDEGNPAADDKDRFTCGGSLLDESHVLTAGHCFDVEGESPPDPLKDIAVVLGRTTLTSQKGQVRRITEVKLHPRYSTRPLEYDVAVLTLDKPVTGIAPVTVVPSGDKSLEKAGNPATFTGWGSLEAHQDGEEFELSSTDGMKQATVPVVADSACRSAYQKDPDQPQPNMSVSLCTSTANKIGHCLGDSGGPLFVTAGDQVVQFGIVSFAPGCGDPRFPSVYARLSNSDINAFVRESVG
ncbi:Trypsin [Actinoplanes philippinensis]|uniref:Trypsin n=1 Tax=Actinoplanes philippinensis TaxID=35752 RepID=A0A1I2I5P5_9ACTN|nr:serine protease [Actinoplanes philippinensis]SFF37789.1 Trypsin [Actinoplanes philippinensis]